MRVCILQHEPNEWIGSMLPWFDDHQYALKTILVYENESLPTSDEFDWLLVMGGGMSVYEEQAYPWLINEKSLIREAIAADKKVLGICLGAQLIASALGADVYAGEQQEIGWFSVAKTHDIASWYPTTFTPLSWHGDRFDLPTNAISFAKSEITPHQGFTLGNRVWALQFHLEAFEHSVRDFYAVSDKPLPEGDYVQSYQQMSETTYLAESKQIMHNLLNVIAESE
jgi:GMP synthase-like glutamine amidotransferase